MADKLTIKQEKFVQGLFAGLSQREAYKQAFNCENMKDKTIDERACVLAGLDKVKTRLDELTNELKERNMVTVERVLEELSHIAFDDIKNYLSFGTEKVLVGYDDKGKPVADYKTIVALKDSDTIDTRSISEVSLGKDGQFKFKLYCKDDALVKIGETLGMFKNKLELTGANGGPIETSSLTPEERQARINELIAKRGK